ncbi:MAG: S9 family peptidase [Anaerolineales bacterium]|jgi:dipeptidyl aminopeptidase/acylaminoacyl peptidase
MEAKIDISEKYERQGLPSVSRPDIKPPQGWNLSLISSLERIRSHRLSPDGKTIAFIKDSESLSDVYLIPSNGGWPRRISTNRNLVAYWDDEIPQWSPDSKWIAFCIDGHVHLVSSNGGLPKKITDFAEGAFAPKWMPDSNHLIVGVTRHEADQLVLTDRDGSWPRALTDSSDGDHWDPQPSPDGKSVAFLYRPFDDLNRLDICLIDLESGGIRKLYGKPKVRTHSPRWSPDGKWIAFICQENGHDDLWIVKPAGEGLHQVTKLGYDIAQYAFSPDSRRIALEVIRQGSFDLFLWEQAGGNLTVLRTGMGVHSNPNWTPDGKTITFEYESPILPPDIYRIDVESKEVTQLTFSQSPALAKNKLVIPEIVSYKSYDGLEIPAFLFKPENSNGAAVLYPHGGPSSLYPAEWDILAQYLLAKGYTYLAPNYRGSTGYGVEFEHANYNDWGVGDTQDCLYGAKYLRSLTGIDPARIAIMGGSYGGYMTICSLSRDPEYLFACGITKYGDSNLYSSWAQCKRELRLYTEIFLGHPAKNRAAYEKGSPINDIKNVKKPVLILHGLLDDVVPPAASEEWVEALKAYGKTFEYKTYPDEPHGFLRRKNQLDVYARIERFLDWYLMV